LRLHQYGAIAAAATVGVLGLAACGTNNNTSGTSGGGGSVKNTAANVSCAKGSVTAAGSTAQQNAMDSWVKAYQERCSGATINYQGVGSGAGIEQFTQGTVDFAGSDSALKPSEHTQADKRCKTGKAVDLPMVTGPIAVVYNLAGVDGLRLTPTTLAKIFAGKITKWNDAQIKVENPGVNLPSTAIQAFHRSDSSGTTDNFTKYLSAAAPGAWSFGHDKVWKTGNGQGAKGSDGVAAAVKSTPGAIAYDELSYANLDGLQTAKVRNGSGKYVSLTPAAAAKAVDGAKVVGTGDDLTLQIDYNTKVSGAWPIVLVTYEIVCEHGSPHAGLIKSLLTYTSSADGQRAIANPKLGYAPLPSGIAAKVRDVVSRIS
jgi:phosphate transport system substrate-binding protein